MGKFGATVKGVVAKGGEGGRQANGGETGATLKGGFPDESDGVR